MRNLLLVFGVLLLSSLAAAETKIGYVDIELALAESEAGSRAPKDYEKEVKARRDSLEEKQEKLKSEAKFKEELARAELQNKIQAERVRISRDLHDHIGSQLTIITSSLDGLAYKEQDSNMKHRFEEISDHARETMAQLRETIWAMNNEAVNLDMLTAKLREYIDSALSITDLKDRTATVTNNADEEVNLSPAETINIFRVCQEAINNAIKYAEFRNLRISINISNAQLVFSVEDDGKGFDVGSAKKSGYGLRNMGQRIKDIGGSLNLVSKPGSGSRVQINLPINKASFV